MPPLIKIVIIFKKLKANCYVQPVCTIMSIYQKIFKVNLTKSTPHKIHQQTKAVLNQTISIEDRFKQGKVR